MDEADALADDIAVLSSGRLACHGSSLFLKVDPRPPCTCDVSGARASGGHGKPSDFLFNCSKETTVPEDVVLCEQERYGEGHILTVALSAGGDASAAVGVEALVRRMVPGAAALRCAGGEIALRLPSEASGSFPDLLDALERHGADNLSKPV